MASSLSNSDDMNPVASTLDNRSDAFPTVLRRALAGPESRGWTETGPISPVWGELGQLVATPLVLPASSGQSAERLQLRAAGVANQPSNAGTSPRQSRSQNAPGPKESIVWSAPTTIDRHFPPVFRSALVDRAEPGAEEQATAHGIMATSIGAPLPPMIRRSMEERLGSDFGAVRVHSGSSIARATDLLAARAMSRGTDVFMPGGVADRPEADTMPLLAHELTHVAAHLGETASPIRRSPLVLAQRTSNEESRAEQVERAVSSEMQSRFPTVQSGISSAMTLARGIANTVSPSMPLTVARQEAPAQVQRDETGGATVTSPPQVIPDAAAPAPADAGAIAEKVYALLERRLLVERERGGHRRP